MSTFWRTSRLGGIRERGPPLKVTVCQMHDRGADLARDWEKLVLHVQRDASDLVLLPETAFSRPFIETPDFDARVWKRAIVAHERWQARLVELAPAVVVGTRPLQWGQRRFNQGFVWTPSQGIRWINAKAALRTHEGAWEGRWYHTARAPSTPIEIGHVVISLLIGSELWSSDERYRQPASDIDLLLTPRIGPPPGDLAWIIAGSKAAKRARAYGLSSSRTVNGDSSRVGGWIVDPGGKILAITSESRPFVSAALELRQPTSTGSSADAEV